VLRRLAPLDRALVLLGVPLWLLCLALAIRVQVDGGGLLWLALESRGPDAHPVLIGASAFLHPPGHLEAAGLQPGDRALQLGDVDLRGLGTFGVMVQSGEAAAGRPSVPLIVARDGERHEASLALTPVSLFRPLLALALSFPISALILLFRASPTPLVRAYLQVGIVVGITTCFFPGSPSEYRLWVPLFVLGASLVFPVSLRFWSFFPDDRAPSGLWPRVLPWVVGLPAGVFALLNFTRFMKLAEWGVPAAVALGAGSVLTAATRKFLGGDPLARRQMKWVLFGVFCAALPAVLASVAALLDPNLAWLFFASLWAWAVFPFFLLLSVVRFNLFDVDRLISGAAAYNVLAVVAVGLGLVIVPRAAEAGSALLGLDPGTGEIAFSLGLAALVIPAQRHLRPQIERLLFRERYAVDHGIAELLPALTACTDARELTERLGTGLVALLRPEACAMYSLAAETYAPVFVEGQAAPAAFEADGPLIGTLRGRTQPLALSAVGRRADEATLSAFDRAALETLGAEVVVPIRRGEALVAFLCLGPKRSGDVYTPTDLSLLGALGETVSQQLVRFDQEETIRAGRAMQESLRRYVPGAIAEELAEGADLSSREREVTVLFVDIRGYTGLSEGRRAEDIFDTVNRYTETVSSLVRRHQGSVVEFNGDGMMAVFGAPRELADKERAAVAAGREIVREVSALHVEDAEGRDRALSVGVGIATGLACVGNIRAVDRMIWSAIGNTTNLAARLQSLTRELDAAIVVDAETHARAGEAGRDFVRHEGMAIRGSRERRELFALPLRG
jgi:class 3 adenylate cyclase